MAIIEQIIQLKQQGKTEGQITQMLREQGYSPKDVNEGISQSRIKSMINSENNPYAENYANEDYEQNSDQEMQLSMMQNPEAQNPDSGFNPSTTNVNPPYYKSSVIPYSEIQAQEAYANQAQEQSGYPQYPEYKPQETMTNTETITDISEQIIEEKLSDLKKQIESIERFKEDFSPEVERLKERIGKIENNIDNLQMAIIRKIGEYGENIQNISKEMHETQNSFSKILNPLTDNIRELQKISGRSNAKEELKEDEIESDIENNAESPRDKKKKMDFESYLR
jgi:hypothetical protein